MVVHKIIDKIERAAAFGLILSLEAGCPKKRSESD
jgi:hypothetical protein